MLALPVAGGNNGAMTGGQNADTSETVARDQAGDRFFILGTAGHIDHGKSALVEALTGTNPDRLPEEKRRGMTIELGFAELQVGEITFGVVDVPGHEKFIRTMVAGATGMDIAMLIVAADDSVMPQTVEHVEVLDLLGIRQGVVAITKCDLVDAELIDVVEAEVGELLARTSLRDAAVVRVSSLQKTGLDDLRKRLVEAAARIRREELDQPFRMPIDRAFTVAGRGTVATGSVISGRVRRGDAVDIWPTGERARVREIQSHGQDREEAGAGQRAAINLQGVDRSAVERGFELAAAGAIAPTRLLDVQIQCLASHRRPIRNHSRLRLCLGTREAEVRCVLLSGGDLAPGERGLVQLRCREPLTATYGQRFIVRDENAARTAGGGVVLRSARRRLSARHAEDVEGLRRLLEGEAEERLAEAIRDGQFKLADEAGLALAAGLSRTAVPGLVEKLKKAGRLVALDDTGRAISAEFLGAFQDRAAAWLRQYHETHRDEPGCLAATFEGWLERKSGPALGKLLLSRLIEGGAVRMMGRYVCLKEFAPALSGQDEKLLAMILEELHRGAFQPPLVVDLVTLTKSNVQRVQKLIKMACASGQAVQVDSTIYLHGDRERELREQAVRLYEKGGPFTVAQLREALGSSRKYAVPIVEYLDRVGFTRRSGDLREPVQGKPT